MSSASKPAVARYHHGDLRTALLAAAEAELREKGVEGFSLRGVAKRAGVSHAAPAHHFKDADGLLTALAAESFRRFLAAMEARAATVGDDPVERLVATGLGYIDYAATQPAMFDLQFASTRPDHGDADLAPAAKAAYGHLQQTVAAVLATRGHTLADRPDAIPGVWAAAHGLAALFARRPAPYFAGQSAEQREATFARILRATVLGLTA